MEVKNKMTMKKKLESALLIGGLIGSICGFTTKNIYENKVEEVISCAMDRENYSQTGLLESERQKMSGYRDYCMASDIIGSLGVVSAELGVVAFIASKLNE
jgi:hypothetical protein